MQLTCAAGDDLHSSCCRLDSAVDQNRHDLSSIQRRPQTALQSANTAASGVVSGTTVRALVLGRFSQKKLKIELKYNAKNEQKYFIL